MQNCLLSHYSTQSLRVPRQWPIGSVSKQRVPVSVLYDPLDLEFEGRRLRYMRWMISGRRASIWAAVVSAGG